MTTVEQASPLLTHRQLEVLTLINDGFNPAQIAQHLHLSITTVRSHTEAARRVFNTPFTAHAVRRAGELGLLPEVTS